MAGSRRHIVDGCRAGGAFVEGIHFFCARVFFFIHRASWTYFLRAVRVHERRSADRSLRVKSSSSSLARSSLFLHASFICKSSQVFPHPRRFVAKVTASFRKATRLDDDVKKTGKQIRISISNLINEVGEDRVSHWDGTIAFPIIPVVSDSILPSSSWWHISQQE